MRIICILVCILSLSSPVYAHVHIQEQIARISAQLKSDPSNTTLLLKRGYLYQQHYDFELALADYQAAEASDPESAPFELLYGKLFFAAKDYHLAEKYLQAFIRSSPEHFDGLLHFARVLKALHNRELSLKMYERAFSHLESVKPSLVLEYVRTIYQEGRGNPQEALEQLLAALRENPGNMLLEREALTLEQQLGDYDAALRRVNRLENLSQSKAPWQLERARLEFARGNRSKAEQIAQTILTEHGTQPEWVQTRKLQQEFSREITHFLDQLRSDGMNSLPKKERG